jgi:hypothetical protein
MLSRKRLRRLERSPYFLNLPGRIDPEVSLALRHISDEDLVLLISIAEDEELGVCRTLSQRDAAVVSAYNAALANMK